MINTDFKIIGSTLLIIDPNIAIVKRNNLDKKYILISDQKVFVAVFAINNFNQQGIKFNMN